MSQKKSSEIEDLNTKIPIDPTVKVGKLANGLTYYLKKNAKPKDKAVLRLVVNAGSILEDEDQLGLAHFVEHMAFNGTKNFKKNELINYLQSIGVEFGADLNAHTSFDETVYKLLVPTDNKEIFDTSLQIMRDWADGIEFSDEEIDNERGIVAEELRARSGARMRMYYESIPLLTNNSRYSKRTPIGTLDVIMNSKYASLKRFYTDWYRPDLMALVLVGDFDLVETEQKIKSVFDDLNIKSNPKERIHYTIPDNTSPKIGIITDPEATGVNIAVYHKKTSVETKNLKDYKKNILQRLYTGMLRQRLSEKAILPNAPFLSASAGIGHFLGDKDSYYLRASLKEDAINKGIEILLEESERAKRYGFTSAELKRYKAYMLNRAAIFKNEEGKLPSKYYADQYTGHFTDKRPIVGTAFQYEFYKKVFPSITIEDVNQIAQEWIKDDNISIIINAPNKKSLKLPNSKEVMSMLKKVKTKKITQNIDTLNITELMSKKPQPGKIVKTSYNSNVDVTTWKFANGITVLAKPTTLQNDLISMIGFRPGGSSLGQDSLYVSVKSAGEIIGSSGINGISSIHLKKMNMGKTVSVKPRINFYDDLFSGNSSSKDLETMLQMTHLYFTAPNKDKGVFEAQKANMIALTKDMDENPNIVFEERINQVMTQNHLRGVSLKEQEIEEGLKLDDVYEFYKERFSSANGFTFIFAGSFDLEILKEQVIRYLASLPSDLQQKSTWRDIGLRRPTGVIKETIEKGIDNKSKVDMRFTGTLDFSIDKKRNINLLAKALKIKLTEELREKMAGVYGVKVSGFATDKPYDWYRLNIRFTCAPENVEKLTKKVFEEIDNIKNNGISEIDLKKIKEAELSNAKDGLKYNEYWIYKLKTAIEYDLDIDEIVNYKSKINKLSSKDFKDAANTYFNTKNYAEFILIPEKK